MRIIKYTAAAILIGTGIAIAPALLPAQAVEQPFDHSNCQYPDRWSNPVNGCDNSDPAVPECIKAASSQEAEAACIADFVKQYEKPIEPAPIAPIIEQPAAAPQPEPTQTCGK